MRHISFRRTGATLNRASSFPRPQFSVYFIYTFTESESRIWPQLALNQRSWTIAFGLPPDTFVCPAQYFANLNVNVFVVGHIFLRALQTLPLPVGRSPVWSTHWRSRSSPFTYLSLQPTLQSRCRWLVLMTCGKLGWRCEELFWDSDRQRIGGGWSKHQPS